MEQLLIAGLECWAFGRENGKGAPVVFFLHGLTQSIQFSLKYCRSLADNGCIAIAVDHRNHGMRTVDFSKNQKGSENYLVDTYGMYTGTARDVSDMIDFLPATFGFTPSKIGVAGFSLGAHASFVAAVIDERINFVIPICGCADRKLMLKSRFVEKGGSSEEFDAMLPKNFDEVFQKYDPIHNVEKLKGCSAFLISGGDDLVVPSSTNEELLKRVEERFGKRENFIMRIYSEARHEITKSMWSDILDWIESISAK